MRRIYDQPARGAAGAIAASAHLATVGFVRLHRLMQAGALAEARALWQRLRPLTAAAFAEPNPAPVQAALARQGWLLDELRAPMWPASDATAAALLAAAAAAAAAIGPVNLDSAVDRFPPLATPHEH